MLGGAKKEEIGDVWENKQYEEGKLDQQGIGGFSQSQRDSSFKERTRGCTLGESLPTQGYTSNLCLKMF